MSDQIKRLAGSARMQRLTYRQARYLFDAMIISDALFLESGNVSAAADRLGVRRETINKIIMRRATNDQTTEEEKDE